MKTKKLQSKKFNTERKKLLENIENLKIKGKIWFLKIRRNSLVEKMIKKSVERNFELP